MQLPAGWEMGTDANGRTYCEFLFLLRPCDGLVLHPALLPCFLNLPALLFKAIAPNSFSFFFA